MTITQEVRTIRENFSELTPAQRVPSLLLLVGKSLHLLSALIWTLAVRATGAVWRWQVNRQRMYNARKQLEREKAPRSKYGVSPGIVVGPGMRPRLYLHMYRRR